MSGTSDLSDADIAERTARDVMGWVKDDIGEGRYWKPLETDEGHTIGVSNVGYEPPWDPVNDARHRDRLIERANELGLAIKVMRYPDGTRDAHVYDTNEDGWPKTGIASSHKEEGRAVCEAILKAINQQKQN